MMPASSPNIVEEVVIIASSPLRDRENALDVTSGNIYDFRCVLCSIYDHNVAAALDLLDTKH